MSTKLSDINPELRFRGVLLKLLMRPAVWFYKLLRRVDSKRVGSEPPQSLLFRQRWIGRKEGVGKIRVCVYRPRDISADVKLPAVFYIHGGGYIFGNPEMANDLFEKMVETRSCVIIAPDYQKSFEAPYPAAIDDCYQTLLWLDQNREEVGVNDDDIAVVGHSAGGGLTAALSLRARDQNSVKIAFQMPIYPMIDDRMNTASSKDNTSPVWNSKSNAIGWSLYLGDLEMGGSKVPADAAPARAESFAGLPPTATYVGELDPFRDETVTYVQELREAGVPVSFLEMEGAFHASEIMIPNAEISKRTTEFILGRFAEGIDRQFDTWSTN